MELGQIPGQQVKPEINFYITDYRGEGNILFITIFTRTSKRASEVIYDNHYGWVYGMALALFQLHSRQFDIWGT